MYLSDWLFKNLALLLILLSTPFIRKMEYGSNFKLSTPREETAATENQEKMVPFSASQNGPQKSKFTLQYLEKSKQQFCISGRSRTLQQRFNSKVALGWKRGSHAVRWERCRFLHYFSWNPFFFTKYSFFFSTFLQPLWDFFFEAWLK